MTGLRAAFHVHSDWSYDGRLTLDELAVLFSEHRYDVVFMCEHDRGFDAARKAAYDAACAEASKRGALLIPGIEYADPEDCIHLPVWGPVPFQGEGVLTDDVLRACAEAGGAAVIAHPRRREAWRRIEPSWLELCSGLEIWTRKWDGWAPNPWAVEQATSAGMVPVVSLDLHHRRQMFPLAMELTLEGPVGPAGCVEAFRRGRVRPLIHRLPVAALMHGPLARTAGGVEKLRRPVFLRGRLVRDRLARA